MNKLKTIKIKKPLWIIGDIHGDLNLLKKLIKEIPEENPNLCFVGDLIDRGDQSIEVIDFIIKNKYYCVKGNHEEIMIREDYKDLWLNSDGYNTMKAYEKNKNKYKEHKKFIEELPIIIKFEMKNEKNLYVSHSGFDIDSLEKEDFNYEEVFWNKKLEYPESKKGINIFGHKIRSIDKAIINKSHIGIDSGGYLKYNEEKGTGMLTAIEYPSLKRIYVRNKK